MSMHEYQPPQGRPRSIPPDANGHTENGRIGGLKFSERLRSDPDFAARWRAAHMASKPQMVATKARTYAKQTAKARAYARRLSQEETDHTWMTVRDYAKARGINYTTVYERMKSKGWRTDKHAGIRIVRVPNALPPPMPELQLAAPAPEPPRRRWWHWLAFWR